jgi:hypothetical protein
LLFSLWRRRAGSVRVEWPRLPYGRRLRFWRRVGGSRSQTFKVLSREADTACRPIGAYCHAVDKVRVAAECAELAAGLEISNLQGLVSRGRNQPGLLRAWKHGFARRVHPFGLRSCHHRSHKWNAASMVCSQELSAIWRFYLATLILDSGR